MNKTVTITREEWEELTIDSFTLEALVQGGVDNWEWYGDSIFQFEQELGTSIEELVQNMKSS